MIMISSLAAKPVADDTVTWFWIGDHTEYQRYFGFRYNPFKDVYLIRFPMQSLEGKKYLAEGKNFKLVISSPERKTEVDWDVNNCKQHVELLRDEDFYWN